MLLMFERGIRRRITQSVHRWAQANNPYMGSEYDPSKPTRYLQYLDANNLYGWAMSQPLPTGGFKWVDVHPDEIEELVNLGDKGYLLEVDVAYPRELHDYHNDLPFMCGRMNINGVEKLVPNLYYKKRYVIHIRALDQALKHGLVLERIHRAIEFNQSAWMTEYIDFNTRLRTEAKNDFEKDFYKLMNNDIETDDFYKDIADDVESRFDANGYALDRPLPVGKNKKVIGLMKDELGGGIMKEFVTLKPKMYAYKVGSSESKKCKGIKKCVVKKTISFEDYKTYLFSGEASYRSQLMFRSSKHEVRTLKVNKLALNRDDDKHLTIDGIASLARGHYTTRKKFN